MVRAAVTLFSAALLAGCGDRGADQLGNTADNDLVEILPPDESVATPTNDLLAGVIDTPPRENAVAPNPATAIPAAMHGRWGLVPADCTSERGDAKGLITIAADTIRFYESIAKPQRIRESSTTRIAGEFAFTGEGMTWSSPMIWSVENGKLVRIDSERDSRLVYTRCPPGEQGVR